MKMNEVSEKPMTINRAFKQVLDKLVKLDLLKPDLVKDKLKQRAFEIDIIEKACNCKIDLVEGVKTIDGPFFYWQIVSNNDRQMYRIASEGFEGTVDLLNTLSMLLDKTINLKGISNE